MLHYSGPKEKPIPPTGSSIEKLIEQQLKICGKCVELFGLESELTKRQFATLGELTYLLTIL